VIWQNNSNSWPQPTTVHRCTCLQWRPTTCAETLTVQTEFIRYFLSTTWKGTHSKVQIRFRKGCCCHSPEQRRPAWLKIKRANQIATKRVILLFCKLDSLWWLHSVPLVRLYSVSLGVIFPDYDSLPHYMEGNMTFCPSWKWTITESYSENALSCPVHRMMCWIMIRINGLAWLPQLMRLGMQLCDVTACNGMSHLMGRVPKW